MLRDKETSESNTQETPCQDEQLLKLSFSMFNQLLHSLSTHMRVR